ncbi:MAG: DegT/DnrJ/EryC1/StrS family aminotransferase [Paracoccaceae bacterium]
MTAVITEARPDDKSEPPQHFKHANVIAAAQDYGDDGSCWARAFEADLRDAAEVADAVVVSSDSGSAIVLIGALGLAPGDQVSMDPQAPIWLRAACSLSQLHVTSHDDINLATKAVFCFPGREPDMVSAHDCTLVAILSSFAPDDWSTQMAGFTVGMVPLNESEPLSVGEGGVLLLQDRALAVEARDYAQFGRLDGIRLGVNQKLSPVQCALGRQRLYQLMGHHYAPNIKPSKQTDLTAFKIPDRFDPTSPADMTLLHRALDGDLSGGSPLIPQYEAALAHWFTANWAVATSSGYSAVLLALAALDLKPGDEVLLAPTCPLCTVFALTTLGLIPVFCDTRQNRFSIDIEFAKSVLSAKTRAIIEVPMWGYPVDAKATASFAKHFGLTFVLDLALGHGIEVEDSHIWHHADIATFSTHASKVLVTGEGGFVLTNSAFFAEKLRTVRHPANGSPGLNYRLGALQAALGLARLPNLHSHIVQRRANMQFIADNLDHPDLMPFPIMPDEKAGGVKMLVVHRKNDGRALNTHLARHGIPSDILTYRCRPLYEFPVLSHREADCTNAQRTLASVATLPVHPDITSQQLDHMVHTLNSLPQED